MRKILFIALLLAGVSASAQEKEVKKGWSLGALPTVTYSVDNGFQAGAFGDVYYYGDGSTYPDPIHKISWEGSYYTHSHRMRFYLAYDSKYLIPNMRVNASLTYVRDPLYSFWGFNGPASIQDYALWSNRNLTNVSGRQNVNYYGMSRDMFRALANFQGQIVPHLNWAAGINFWWWKMGDMRDNGVTVNKETKEKRYYDTETTLYNRYVELGAITEAEKYGGLALEVNAGLVYDTRDIEAAPNRGIWAEAYLNGNVLQHPYLKACVYFRHYIDIPLHLPAGDPVFAYRLAWQQTIAGETPVYMIQNVPLLVQRNMISEGFGSPNTIRGMRENRVLAEGLAWTNLELRVKLVSFKLFNQYFYIALNPFFDAGVITKGYRTDILKGIVNDESLKTAFDYSSYRDYLVEKKPKDLAAFDALHNGNYAGTIYDESNMKKLIYSAGGGLKIAMNQNFIISAEFAKCFTPGLDAGLWIGIRSNYQF
ncbi:MAG: hypothetical protein IJ714_09345 [Bacteroidales bacterium]|nr:hypothetical protein [Bacteroidales bacterium]